MSNTYQLTTEILAQIKRIKPDYVVKSDYSLLYQDKKANIFVEYNQTWYSINDVEGYYTLLCPALNPENITQLLLDFSPLLRKSPVFKFWEEDEVSWLKWFKPNFNLATPSLWVTDQEAVLKALLEILKSL